MTSTRKGIVVAIATVAVVCAQLAAFREADEVWARNLGTCVFWLLLVGIPYGACAGVLAGRLRSDRVLGLAGFGLVLPSFLGFVVLLIHDSALTELATRLVGMSSIPIVVAALALERWTRPPAPIPPALPCAHGLRPWTAVELAVVLAIAAALASAGLAAATPGASDFTFWFRRETPFGSDHVIATITFLVGSVVPIGVVLGRLASVLSRFRLVTLLAVAALGTIWIASSVATFASLDFRGEYAIPPAVAAIVLERLSRKRRGTPPSPALLGMLLGIANAVVISAAMVGVIVHRERWEWELVLVPCIALVFSLPAGALIGTVAGGALVNRKLVLHSIGLGSVALLAAGFELPIVREPGALFIFGCALCTTAIFVGILERITRPPAS